MPERLNKLKRLRGSWEQRKKSSQIQIAALAASIAASTREVELLMSRADEDVGTFGQFPDLCTSRLLTMHEDITKLNEQMDETRDVHKRNSMNFRLCQTLESKERLEVGRQDECASLESSIDIFLRRKM